MIPQAVDDAPSPIVFTSHLLGRGISTLQRNGRAPPFMGWFETPFGYVEDKDGNEGRL